MVPWRMAMGEVDGEPVDHQATSRRGDGLTPRAVVRFDVMGRQVTRIADYGHCPWVLSARPVLSSSANPPLTDFAPARVSRNARAP